MFEDVSLSAAMAKDQQEVLTGLMSCSQEMPGRATGRFVFFSAGKSSRPLAGSVENLLALCNGMPCLA